MESKKYSVISGFIFLMREMRSHTIRSFRLLPVGVFVKVLIPFAGIWLPNIVVRAITDKTGFGNLAAAVSVLGLVMVAGSFAEQYVTGVLEAEAPRLSQGISDRLFYKKLYCDYENLEDKELSGFFDEAERCLWYGQHSMFQAAGHLVLFGSGVFGFVLYLAILWKLPKLLLLLMVAGTCVSFFFSDLGQKERAKRENFLGDAVRRMSDLQKSCAEPKAGKDIRLYGMYGWFEARFALVHRQIREDYIRLGKKNFLSALITVGAGTLMEICGYLVLTGRVLSGRMDLAEYVLCIGAVLGFSTWVKQIVEQLQKLWIMKADVDVIRRCLDMPDRSAAARGGSAGADIRQITDSGKACEIVFDHVFYRYPGSDKDTISDLSFRIKKGERIALVGMNGAGKTTCVKLLCGLLTPTAGEIRINGIRSAEFDRQDYYRLFSTVFQEVNLFPASIRENITGKTRGEADEGRMEECLKQAGLWEKICSMAKQADTLLVKELDEPTAALDPISENNVYRKYLSLTGNCTSVFISHRLASTRFCSRILFLDEGRILEEGSHEELVAAGGSYAEAFEVQSRYYKEHPQENGEEVSFA